MSELTTQKLKLRTSNTELKKTNNQLSTELAKQSRVLQQTQNKLTETNNQLQEEIQLKISFDQQLRNTIQELELTKSDLAEERTSLSELENHLTKERDELQAVKLKNESDSLYKSEELEIMKKKFAQKMHEADEQVEQALFKCTNVEKSKQRLHSEIEDLLSDVDKANINVAVLEKKQKAFDKTFLEWRERCNLLKAELELSQKETRQSSSDLFKLQTEYEEKCVAYDGRVKENKTLSEEVSKHRLFQ